jgi:hypothetical protein
LLPGPPSVKHGLRRDLNDHGELLMTILVTGEDHRNPGCGTSTNRGMPSVRSMICSLVARGLEEGLENASGVYVHG